LKKKSTKRIDEDSHKLLNDKKISEAQLNFEKEPIEIDNKNLVKEQPKKSKNKKRNIWKRIGKKKKVSSKETLKIKDFNKSSTDFDVNESDVISTPKKHDLIRKNSFEEGKSIPDKKFEKDEPKKTTIENVESSKDSDLDIDYIDSLKNEEIKVTEIEDIEVKDTEKINEVELFESIDRELDKVIDKIIQIEDHDEQSEKLDDGESKDNKICDDRELLKKKDVEEVQSVPEKDDDTEESEKPIFKDIDSSKETILDINVVDSDKEKEIDAPWIEVIKKEDNEKINQVELFKSIDKELERVKNRPILNEDFIKPSESFEDGVSEDSSIDDDRELFRKKDVDVIHSSPEKKVVEEEAETSSIKDVDASKESYLDINVIESLKDKVTESLKIEKAEVKDKVIETEVVDESSPEHDKEDSGKVITTKKRRIFSNIRNVVVKPVPKRVKKRSQKKVTSHPKAIIYPKQTSDGKADHDEIVDKEVTIDSILLDVKDRDIKKSKEDLSASKPKFPFFKKQKSFKAKTNDIDKEKSKSDDTTQKPMFRVDNIPLKGKSAEAAKLLDDKIKDSISEEAKKEDSTQNTDIAKKKAILLFEKHLKEKKPSKNELEKELDDSEKELDDSEKELDDSEKELDDSEKELDDSSTSTVLDVSDDDPEHEHVFFDEEDSSFKGWTPKITEKDKEIALSLTPKQDTEIETRQIAGSLELPKEVLTTESVELTDLGFSDEEWEELDFYSLHEPFVYVEILRDKESLDKCYFLVEVSLTEEEENLLAFIKETMKNLEIDTDELDNKGSDEYLLDKLDLIYDEYNIKTSDESRKKIYYYIGKTSLGLGKIDPLMKDPNIEDISCDGTNVPLFLYHRKYGSLKSNISFEDDTELSSYIFKLAQKCGKHISIADPMLDATMPDGSRIQMTLSDEITAKGSTFTIRKFRSDPFSPPDLVEFNTMSSEMIAFMWLAVENGINTLFVGGTASGKTTALNALTLFIPRESKIVSIEETREINLPHPNWIPGVSRSGFGEVVANKMVGEIDTYDLMKAALRQRPEYILVGEIRGREAYVLFQAMATGHATYSTAHADSAQSLIHRLEGKPINIPRVMLQSLDIVCLHVITSVKNFRARRCKQIIEIIDIDPTTKEILTNEVFHWDPIDDNFTYSGKSYVLERIRAEKDMNREEMTEELNNRKKIVEWMNINNIREFRDVSKLVSQYTESPEDTLKIIEKDDKK
jgi:flagellar protein FlaI